MVLGKETSVYSGCSSVVGVKVGKVYVWETRKLVTYPTPSLACEYVCSVAKTIACLTAYPWAAFHTASILAAAFHNGLCEDIAEWFPPSDLQGNEFRVYKDITSCKNSVLVCVSWCLQRRSHENTSWVTAVTGPACENPRQLQH